MPHIYRPILIQVTQLIGPLSVSGQQLLNEVTFDLDIWHAGSLSGSSLKVKAVRQNLRSREETRAQQLLDNVPTAAKSRPEFKTANE